MHNLEERIDKALQQKRSVATSDEAKNSAEDEDEIVPDDFEVDIFDWRTKRV